MSQRVLIIGNGGYGTALAMVLERKGHDVTLWGWRSDYAKSMATSRTNPDYLKDITIPEGISIIGRGDDLPECDFVINATPTQYTRGAFEEVAPGLTEGAPVISVAKGIENETLLRPTEVLNEIVGNARAVAVLSGPSHAEEVARALVTTVVVASGDTALAKRVQDLFLDDTFRVYTQEDVVGVELGAATKNVIAIATGCAHGLSLGDNAIAAIMTRGLHEMARLGVAMGGRRDTFAGLTGMGDLIVTCTSQHSRNRALGEAIGKGKTLQEIQAGTHKVAEGVATTKSLVDLAARLTIDLPITTEVHKVLFEGKSAKEAVFHLMTRGPKPEIETID